MQYFCNAKKSLKATEATSSKQSMYKAPHLNSHQIWELLKYLYGMTHFTHSLSEFHFENLFRLDVYNKWCSFIVNMALLFALYLWFTFICGACLLGVSQQWRSYNKTVSLSLTVNMCTILPASQLSYLQMQTFHWCQLERNVFFTVHTLWWWCPLRTLHPSAHSFLV